MVRVGIRPRTHTPHEKRQEPLEAGNPMRSTRLKGDSRSQYPSNDGYGTPLLTI